MNLFFSDTPRVRGQSSFYTGSLAKMIDMARIARIVLDQEDPMAKLSTPGFDDATNNWKTFWLLVEKSMFRLLIFISMQVILNLWQTN